MAMKIDADECIDCGACVEPCPNTAIFAGGESYQLDGKEHEALSDKYYIVPELCTECVGHFDSPQCVDACPVDCIPKDPDHQETQEQLQAKAEKIKASK